jgi:hypothetical protein
MRARTAGTLVGLAGLLVTGAPDLARGQGLVLTGYADFEAVYENVGGDEDNTDFFFDNHHFNLIAVGYIVDDVFAAVEIEYEHAGEEIALEYGYVAYTGLRDIRIMAGKFIVPFGRFNKDLHPTPLNKIPARPYGFSQVMPQTYNDVGLWVSGTAALNEDMRAVVDAFVVNGLMGEDGGSIRSMRDNDREEQVDGVDNNKALGGRLGVEMPFVGLDFGLSAYTGNYSDTSTDDLTITLFGLDGSFQKSGWVFRGEYVSASQDATGGELSKSGYYVQASYLLASRFEPVVRYSSRDMPGDADDRSRVALGASVYVTPAACVRLAYLLNSEPDGFETDDNAAILQFNVLF